MSDVTVKFGEESKHVSLESGTTARIDFHSANKLNTDDIKNFKVKSGMCSIADTRQKS
ncbi:hypothetical protein [Bartonella florencae]|uniref:hypothetical protein n=1 Tax=Bartonella florencae TaxID=928210 RepID=UPI0002DE8342|nr:hypothetical protein [Bartonella florencae]